MSKIYSCLTAWFTTCLLLVAIVSSALAEQQADPWLAQIDDPALTEFVESLIAKNPDIRIAEASAAATEARAEAAARPLYNPELEFETESAIDDSWSLGVTQSIDWAGKKSAQRKAAEARSIAAKGNLAQSRQATAAAILSKLVTFWSAVELAKLADSRSGLMQDFAQQAELRHTAGDINRLQRDLALLAFAEARMQRASAAADLSEMISELIAFGADDDVSSWPGMPSSLPALNVRPQDVERIVSILPEVQSAYGNVDAANGDLMLAKRLRRPDPTVSFRAGEEENKSLLGISVSIPLYVRNSFSAEVLAATAMLSESRAQLAAVERDAHVRLLTSMNRYTSMRAAWQEWESTGARSLQDQSDMLQRMWSARELTFAEFLLQARQLVDGQTTAMELRAELWRAWIDWIAAAGLTVQWLQLDDVNVSERVSQTR